MECQRSARLHDAFCALNYLSNSGSSRIRAHRRYAVEHRRRGDTHEPALCLFRDGACKHLVVRHRSGCGGLTDSQTYARMGSARMGTNGNWPQRLLRVRLGPALPRLSSRSVVWMKVLLWDWSWNQMSSGQLL